MIATEADCSKCLKALKTTKSKVTCVDCNLSFHGRCVNLSADDVSYLVEQGEVWRCEPCSKVRRKSMVLESKTTVTYDDILQLVSGIRDDFKRVETSLGVSINACHEEIAATRELVNKQRDEIGAWMKVVEDLKTENATLRKQVSLLETRVDEAEQYSRRNTVEIQGIPLEKNEKVLDLVKIVGRALDYPVADEMVDACHRLRPTGDPGKPPGIVVKMVRRLDAEGLIQKRRVKRNLNTHDLGFKERAAEPVYLNESLAPGRRRLLNAARQVKREKSYTYLWIRGGKILMRKNPGDSVKVVSTMEDIAHL